LIFCALAVQVAGSTHEHDHGTSPGAGLTGLAPIARPAQAHALLRLCLPEPDRKKAAMADAASGHDEPRLIG